MPHLVPFPLPGAGATAAAVIAGALLLAFGRRLFWLTVGLAAFLAAFGWAGEIGGWGPWISLGVGIAAGLAAALLAVLLVKVAVGLAGFVVGGWAAAQAAVAAGVVTPGHAWVAFLLGGLLAGLLAGLLFQAALIAISSLVGAGLIVDALHLEPAAVFLLALTAVGIALQVVLPKGRRSAT